MNSFRARRSTPQGGVASPLPWPTCFYTMHLIDGWRRTFLRIPFERYADDAIVHCRTEKQAPDDTEGNCEAVVGLWIGTPSGEDADRLLQGWSCRKERYTDEKFDFLGYRIPTKEVDQSQQEKSSPISVRQSQQRQPRRYLGRPSETGAAALRVIESLEDLSRVYHNPVIRGWFQYYGRYYRTALYSVIRQLDQELVNWARTEIQEAAVVSNVQGGKTGLETVSRRAHLFAHWARMRGGSLMGAV